MSKGTTIVKNGTVGKPMPTPRMLREPAGDARRHTRAGLLDHMRVIKKDRTAPAKHGTYTRKPRVATGE
jgi:hypothetical protein